MSSDSDMGASRGTGRPWPRFAALPEARPPREPAAHEPWPRWGWFPREQRTWTFAPGPSLVAESPVADPPRPATPPSEPTLIASPPEPPPVIEDVDHVTEEPELDLLPVRRSTSMALVPVRGGEVTLGDLVRAARRAAPVAAIAGMAAAAAMALFRRR